MLVWVFLAEAYCRGLRNTIHTITVETCGVRCCDQTNSPTACTVPRATCPSLGIKTRMKQSATFAILERANTEYPRCPSLHRRCLGVVVNRRRNFVTLQPRASISQREPNANSPNDPSVPQHPHPLGQHNIPSTTSSLDPPDKLAASRLSPPSSSHSATRRTPPCLQVPIQTQTRYASRPHYSHLSSLIVPQIRNKRLARLQAFQQRPASSDSSAESSSPTSPILPASDAAPEAPTTPQPPRRESRLLTTPQKAPETPPTLKRQASPAPHVARVPAIPVKLEDGLSPDERWEDQKLGQIFKVALRVCCALVVARFSGSNAPAAESTGVCRRTPNFGGAAQGP